MEKFRELGMSKELTDVLKKSGFKEPSEIQVKTIPLAMKGRDIIGGSATGSGKTLAFATPIIENLKPNKHVQALILTPTRELAEQVATSIKDFSVNKRLKVLAVYGGVNIETQMRKIPSSDVIVGTPGRIIDHLDRRTLELDKIKFLVLDEVDRMFDMGFSRDVEKILHQCPEKRQTMMFSATISPDIDYLAKKYSNDPAEVSVQSYVDHSKLKQTYYDVPDYQKFSLLVHLLKKENNPFVIVFCSTRKNVEFVTDNLNLNKIRANAIHGGLDQKKRLRVLEEFKKRGEGVLVCTDVAARGLDIDSVSHVYNYDIPSDSKDYVHRIGRTARAGKEGQAINILASRDYENFSNIVNFEKVKIEPVDLPYLERVEIDTSAFRPKRFNSRDRDSSRGRISANRDSSRGRASGRPPREESRGPRRDYSRSDGSRNREPSRDRNSRGPSRGRSDSRSSNSNRRDSSRRPSRRY